MFDESEDDLPYDPMRDDWKDDLTAEEELDTLQEDEETND